MEFPRSVVVHWVDSLGGGSWEKPQEYTLDDLRCVSIGFVVNETDDVLTISTSRFMWNGHYIDTLTIPKMAITSIEDIEWADA